MVWLFEAGILKVPLRAWGLITAFIIEVYQFGLQVGKARHIRKFLDRN
ncbi:hypothetical protein TREAZ_1827 [Leadbettera azotonutricia ZAS-9]|uniref:Uncharacterized protein n=1 Tax=Leadbettera azotonutricia (strain ATCC BAA-888 / DSM 13862 / ZAS-9) TaxID=545695 RepID=F5YBX9_LEAAZ|nr:hypothetical protein TREAZ_1827 [Leadbettera azotonutricia ZAS-9]